MIAVYLLLLTLSQQNIQTVSGRVLDENGQPIAGVQVSASGIYPGGDVQNILDTLCKP